MGRDASTLWNPNLFSLAQDRRSLSEPFHLLSPCNTTVETLCSQILQGRESGCDKKWQAYGVGLLLLDAKVLAPPHPLVKHWIFVMRNDQPPTAISLNSFEIVSGNAIAEIGRLLMFEASREWLLVWMHLLAVAGATVVSSSFGKDEKMAKSEVAVATTLADALYMKDDEVIAAKREHLALTVNETMKKPSRMKIVDNEKSGRVTYQKLKKLC
ncbi:unnamed protein product [Brassica rapa]|uniref:Uncharacterized protein n=1 Tax=Brassica campestris TaxID=3711 RepID=A0A8D9G1Q7_BRACM|nr:unnamed protein product [Brassica rapa]